MKYRGCAIASLAFGLLTVAGCDVSNTGLGMEGTPAPAPARAGGARGQPAATGGTAGGSASTPGAGAGGAGGATAPALTADAAVKAEAPADGGVSGIKTVDAAGSPVDATAGEAGQVPPAPPAQPSVCLTEPGLRLCLAFEGMVLDESPSRLFVNVRQIAFESGPSGQAARVAGGSGITISEGLADLAGEALTLEAWLRPDRLPPAGQRAGLIDRDGHFGLFLLPGGDVLCTVNGGSVTGQGVVRAGEWSSVACTVDGQGMALFINGVRRGSTGTGSRMPGPAGSPLAVGSNSPSGENLEGLLDNVRIWTRGRSAAEICQTALGCR